MPQADKQAGAILGTVLGVGVIATVVIISVANKSGQISKHIAANTPVDTTPAYSLIHTEGPHYNAPSAPSIDGMPPTVSPLPSAPYPDKYMPANTGASPVYVDAYNFPPQGDFTSALPTAPTYQQPDYGLSAQPAFNPSAYTPADCTLNTMVYHGPCPESGKTIKILCPEKPQTRRNIRYIQFNNGTDVYELNGDIRPGAISTFTANDEKTRTIEWINPRARQ